MRIKLKKLPLRKSPIYFCLFWKTTFLKTYNEQTKAIMLFGFLYNSLQSIISLGLFWLLLFLYIIAVIDSVPELMIK